MYEIEDFTVFDLEGDSLEPTKIHVVSSKEYGKDIQSRYDYGEISSYLSSQKVLVGHNIARFDIPVLEDLLDFEVQKDTLLVDTLALSWYLYPDRQKHGLEWWGYDLGVKKPEITDWENLSIEEYTHRCEEDVKINTLLWNKMYKYLMKIYGTHEEVIRFLRYIAFKMDCAREQERSRWKLDVEKCRSGIQKLEAIQEEKVNELSRAMPKVPITGLRKPPSKMFKGDGELSELGRKWREFVTARGLPEEHDEPVPYVKGYADPNPESPVQLKEWLFSLGWEPRTFKENEKGKEIPQINKLKQDGGGVCDSVKELYDKEPALEFLDGLYVARHRLGILRGFLSAASDDGYVKAKIQGLTNTLRFKHAEVVNLPKIDALYGEDVRGCLIAPEGYELCGSDMSSLEDRTKQHYMWKYDPEYVKEMMTDDFDPHLDIAVVAKLMTKEESDGYKRHDTELDLKRLKTVRGIAKNTNYAG